MKASSSRSHEPSTVSMVISKVVRVYTARGEADLDPSPPLLWWAPGPLVPLIAFFDLTLADPFFPLADLFWVAAGEDVRIIPGAYVGI